MKTKENQKYINAAEEIAKKKSTKPQASRTAEESSDLIELLNKYTTTSLRWMESSHQNFCIDPMDYHKILQEYRNQPQAEIREERFIKPTDKQYVEIAILFNDGKMQKSKLNDMIAMAEFIVNRLYENGNVMTKSSIED